MYSNDLICEIIKYIDKNINVKISIKDLENNFFYNRFYIMKLFKKELNVSIIDYINLMRIYKSILDIKNSNSSITRIALNNGFNSIEYFSEIFKKIVGIKAQMFKKYIKNENYNITLEEIEKINNVISKLFIFNQEKEKYLKNIKPKNIKRKVLTIFKEKM